METELDKVMRDTCNYMRRRPYVPTSPTEVRKCERCEQWFFWLHLEAKPRHCNNCAEEIGE